MTNQPTVRIVRPADVALRTVWPREDNDFTPWLAADLTWLDLLGLGPLTLAGTEVQVPGVNRNLDILAQTPDGRNVAIENQYLEADHDHLTRGLAYAVGLHAQALVVIAERHRPEFVAVADYLNSAYEQMAEDGIAVFLVTLTVEGVGEYLVPRFTVVARPNEWRASVHASQEGRLTSVEEFLSASDPEVTDRNKQLIDDWLRRPDASVRTGQGTIALNIKHPFKPGHPINTIYLLYTNGQLVINRGYFIDSGAFPDPEAVETLDEHIRRSFPACTWRGKSYYPCDDSPDPSAVTTFADWLLEYFKDASVQMG